MSRIRHIIGHFYPIRLYFLRSLFAAYKGKSDRFRGIFVIKSLNGWQSVLTIRAGSMEKDYTRYAADEILISHHPSVIHLHGKIRKMIPYLKISTGILLENASRENEN